MALDLLARGLAATARDGVLPALAQFADLPARTIPAGAVRIEAAVGAARGIYSADALATAALAAAHPLFCKADAAGRHFRLLPDAGLIPVACGGAVGFTAEPAADSALADERAILAAAELYRHAIGAAGVRLDARRYAVRRIALPAGTDYFDTVNHLPIYVKSSSRWVSTHPEGTVIHRRKVNGQQPDANDYEECTGYVARFRGGLIFIEGTPPASGDPGPDKHSFTLDNVMLDGGLRLSMGLQFEILDKPVWQQNDRHCGHLTFTGKSGVIGFTSELVYTSHGNPSAGALRRLTIGDECVFGETGGSCINANSITTQIGRCLLYNAYLGIEGWTGDCGYLHATFRNITHGNAIQGGVVSNGGFYYTPSRAAADRLPIGHIDIRLEQCAAFSIGAWIHGKVTAIDCPVGIGGADTFAEGAEAFDIHVISFADKSDLIGAVTMGGGTSGAQKLRNGRVRIDMHRTKYALANGFNHAAGVYTTGSLGPDIDLEFGSTDGMAAPIVYAATNYDNQPRVRGLFGHRAWPPGFDTAYDIEAGAGGTLPNRPVVTLNCSGTATGQYAISLPTAGVQNGSEIILDNFTRNSVNPGVAARFAGAQFTGGAPLVIGNNFNYCRVRYNAPNNKWDVVEAPPPVIASTAYDPPSLAAGASAPIQTLTVNGAVPGDKVRAAFSLDLAGAAIAAWVSAANTVSFHFTNVNGTNPLNLGVGTVSFEVSP